MNQGSAPAVEVSQLVRRHVAHAGSTRVTGLKVAKLSTHIDTPCSHVDGSEGGIAVGCNVKVIGGRYFGAIGCVKGNRGRQKPRFALT